MNWVIYFKIRSSKSVLLALFILIHALFPGNSIALLPSQTTIINVAQSDYVAQTTPYTIASNPANTTVNNVGIHINPPHTTTIQAGTSITLTHTITNTGLIDDIIDVETSSTLGLTVELYQADGITPLSDSNANGKPDAGLLAAGNSIDISVTFTAPETLDAGQTDETTFTARSSLQPWISDSVVDSFTILAAKFWDPLVKTIEPQGQVTQGTTVTYTNTFGNAGNIPATNIVITDILDANLIYIAGSATEPPGISGTIITYDPVMHTISWMIPSIPPDYVGHISFKSRIDPNAPSDASIGNTIDMTSDQTPSLQMSNTATITVVEQPLRITKTANKKVAEIGDYVVYIVTAENVSKSMTVENVHIADSLPQGFRYLKKSTTLDDVTVTDPENNASLDFSIGTLAPGESKTLSYRAIISIDAPLGNGVNTATITGKSPGGSPVFAGPATAAIQIKEGVFNTKGIILGRVYVDLNSDKMPDKNEPGIKGIRLYLEDGTYVITDEQGKFSIFGVHAGEHVLKIDPSTIPSGNKVVPIDSSFAGDGKSRFITVPFGGPARGDFALVQINPSAGAIVDDSTTSEEKKKKTYTFGTGSDAAELPLEKQILTMPCNAEILTPENNVTLEKSWSNIIIRVPSDTPYTLKVNGDALSPKKIGKTIQEKKRNIMIYEFIGISLKPGRNSIVLETTPLGKGKEIKEINVMVPGMPEHMIISPEKADIPSDGQTVVPFTVKLEDSWGNIAFDDHIITIITKKGIIIDDDLDESTPGHQIRAKKGIATFKLKSTYDTGHDKIKILMGSKLEQSADIYFTPALRDWIIVGLGSYTAGKRNVSGHVEKITKTDTFEKGVYQDGKIAFFAKGKILGKYLLTAAYDSEKEKQEDTLFQKVEPDRYYPVYGDASKIGYDAESQEKLYVKIEKNRSYIMFGDYKTDLTQNEFTRYTRAFNGIKTEIDTKHFGIKAFGSETGQTITKDEFPGNGTSGFYFLNTSPVIENSENIVIEVRDRFHSEKVLSTVEKTRYADYDINYANGRILFKEPIPSTDDNLNPVVIIVTYESDDPGEKYYIYGGRARITPYDKLEIGATAIIEEQDIADNTLTGADATLNVFKGSTLKGELAQTDTIEKGNDNAWQVKWTSNLFKKLLMELYYKNVGEDFDNPSMKGNETGTEKYGMKTNINVTKTTTVSGENFIHDNKISKIKLQNNSVGIKHKFKKFNAETGYAYLNEENENQDETKTSQAVYAGVSGQITKKLGASIRRDQVTSSQEIEDYQTKTKLGLNYNLAENTKIFLTQELQEGTENSKDTTLFGTESKITDNTTLKSGYQIDNAASGERTQASIGLNNKWNVTNGLTFNTKIERINNIQGDGSDNTAFAFGSEYLPKKDFKLTGRYEFRRGEDETSNLFTLGTGSKLSDTMSLITKMNLWMNKKTQGNNTIFDSLIGTAYRPFGKKSIYFLNSVRFKFDKQGRQAEDDITKSMITSHEFTCQLSPKWTLNGKYAGKYTWENIEKKTLAPIRIWCLQV